MRIPVIRGLIDRRILVNYRVDPDVLKKLLPKPFRPKVIKDVGIAGICLIRLAEMRTTGFPGAVGISSENAAHRIAVAWDRRILRVAPDRRPCGNRNLRRRVCVHSAFRSDTRG